MLFTCVLPGIYRPASFEFVIGPCCSAQPHMVTGWPHCTFPCAIPILFSSCIMPLTRAISRYNVIKDSTGPSLLCVKDAGGNVRIAIDRRYSTLCRPNSNSIMLHLVLCRFSVRLSVAGWHRTTTAFRIHTFLGPGSASCSRFVTQFQERVVDIPMIQASFLQVAPQFQVFNWTEAAQKSDNYDFVLAANECLAFGGGARQVSDTSLNRSQVARNVQNLGQFGLWLDRDLNRGSSAPCLTFGNSSPLSHERDFAIAGVELWGFI